MNNNIFPESREELISMFIGLGVVIVVVIVLFNFIMKAKGNISLPGIATQNTQNELTKPGILPTLGNDTYEVKKGDSLWNIAVAKYGNGFLWTKIAKENNIKSPGMIEIGQKLNIPTANQTDKTTIGKNIAEKNTTVAETYTVKYNDSLWKIAVTSFNDGYKWTQIWNLNKDKIADPNRLEVGMMLKLK